MMKKRLIRILALVAIVPFVGLLMMNWFSKPPSNLGVQDGKLADCPLSPNCVCTQATADSHKMEPIPFTGEPTEVLERLKSAIGSLPRAKIVEESENYVRAEFTTALMRFVDDVELFVDDEAKLVHFRSASRIGHSDLGVNRQRMEQLRAAYEGQ